MVFFLLTGGWGIFGHFSCAPAGHETGVSLFRDVISALAGASRRILVNQLVSDRVRGGGDTPCPHEIAVREPEPHVGLSYSGLLGSEDLVPLPLRGAASQVIMSPETRKGSVSVGVSVAYQYAKLPGPHNPCAPMSMCIHAQ